MQLGKCKLVEFGYFARFYQFWKRVRICFLFIIIVLNFQKKKDEKMLDKRNTKKEGKDQESKQSNTTPNLGYHKESDKTQVNITYKRAKRSVLSQQLTTRLQGTEKTV